MTLEDETPILPAADQVLHLFASLPETLPREEVATLVLEFVEKLERAADQIERATRLAAEAHAVSKQLHAEIKELVAERDYLLAILAGSTDGPTVH